ncbi:hypothetical protein CI109_100169 [Kwoniella shandongensis]|uniref:Uncharacterized protein n=1 Tax=Kwoniella shandongensis TaxID=1734106 RepID=A0A5M6BSU9_9TREE|nr:uncharacterized protein CI109_005769 [Kwoniella shandongensis]KAA5525887.1 hypothetical protein CI109_005769 [Kwoniella shandongensis]
MATERYTLDDPFSSPSSPSASTPRSNHSSSQSYSSTRDRAPTPAGYQSPSSQAGSSTSPTQVSRYPPTRNLTTPTSPDWLPLTPPRRTAAQHTRSAHSTTSPSTLHRAINTVLPTSPSGPVYYSSPPSAFPSHIDASPHPDDVELTPITPRRIPPNVDEDSPFHDRHSVFDPSTQMSTISEQEDPFEYSEVAVSGGKQKTMSGYKFSGLSPRGWDDQGEEMTFGAMLNEVRPVSEARRSLYHIDSSSIPSSIPTSTFDNHLDSPYQPPDPTTTPRPPRPAFIPPTFRGLFALTRRNDYVLILFPAIILAIVCALIPPYMSIIIGDAFAIFSSYPMSGGGSEGQRKALKDGISTTSIKLTVAGVLSLLLNYLKGVMWQRYGETVAHRLRDAVYRGVQGKSMEWFDLGMGMRETLEVGGEKSEAVGAGGLMSKFIRETDDVRMANSYAAGFVVQNIFTFLLCFILAMIKAPTLALVTLSTIPLIVLTQIVTQIVIAPLHAAERRSLAEASTNVERATSAIATVKVHNAEKGEEERFIHMTGKGKASVTKQGLVWGAATGLTDFFLLGTFVLGFWYGAKMVRDGKVTAGNVMTCFWASLFSATYLQQVVPYLTTVTKGKNSMASLLTVIQDDPAQSAAGNPFSSSANSPTQSGFPSTSIKKTIGKRNSRPVSLRGIRPTRCHGEFNLQNVSFAYPSRPDNPVLQDISIFLPPGETTFIVGGSGSGKSTIAQLLLRLYLPTSGEVTIDDQSFTYLDPGFTREHIAAVQQGCILFDMTVHDNVAMGLAGSGPDPKTGIKRGPKDVTREDVVEACKMAMIHDFIESLPQGYETMLGTGGSSLSGGQRQRMAIARARIRNPTVLILDEATSALDPTSRLLVFQSLKSWRQNRTTIVITHDLSQIVSDDFVYVMKDGHIAEQGFRLDLMTKPHGVFASMAAEQAIEPLPIKDVEAEVGGVAWERGLDEILEMEREFEEVLDDRPLTLRPHTPSFLLGVRPESAMYFNMLDEYSQTRRQSRPLSKAHNRLSWTPEELGSRATSRASFVPGMSRPGSRMSRVSHDFPLRPGYRGSMESSHLGRPSYERTPSRRSMHVPQMSGNGLLHPGWTEKDTTPRASMAIRQRQQRTMSENLDDDLKGSSADLAIATIPDRSPTPTVNAESPLPGVFALFRMYLPHLPAKVLLFIGCVGSIAHGITTPVWSFFLAKLLIVVGNGGIDKSALTKYSLIILALCAAQGLANFISQWSLVGVSARWVHEVRKEAFGRVIKQDKSFFDETQNSPDRLVQILIKDSDDARALWSQVIGKAVTIIVMIGLGIIWAMVVGWKLTLIGLALGPVYGGFMTIMSWVNAKLEVQTKGEREVVGRVFYESIANVRGIRAMALDSAFLERFERDATAASRIGKRAAWFFAFGNAISSCLPLFAQALMNFAGSMFMLDGTMNYQQMLQVYNLVLFSLTFGAAMLDFVPTLSKARVAARDFNRLYQVSTDTSESSGDLRFPITGRLSFSNVAFSYPTRPDIPILSSLSFNLTPGECVAIVGPSGSGKSTIASLLQRFYNPSSGSIKLDEYDLSQIDAQWLRNHIAVVSQSANLFDTTIAQNIAYGSPNLSLGEIQRAAKAANIHDFIQSLPEGYETNLGENASLISGGQAQRLQIARALVRRSSILILDECTSALDVENARAVLDTIVNIKDSHTTIFITHSVEAMRRCDRIVCLGEGKVVEEGTFEQLTARGGVFARLMKTGEWE